MSYIVIPKSISKYSQGKNKNTDIYVYSYIKLNSNFKTGISQITEETISLKLDIPLRTVERIISRLKADNNKIIKIETLQKEKTKRRNLYSFEKKPENYFILDNWNEDDLLSLFDVFLLVEDPYTRNYLLFLISTCFKKENIYNQYIKYIDFSYISNSSYIQLYLSLDKILENVKKTGSNIRLDILLFNNRVSIDDIIWCIESEDISKKFHTAVSWNDFYPKDFTNEVIQKLIYLYKYFDGFNYELAEVFYQQVVYKHISRLAVFDSVKLNKELLKNFLLLTCDNKCRLIDIHDYLLLFNNRVDVVDSFSDEESEIFISANQDKVLTSRIFYKFLLTTTNEKIKNFILKKLERQNAYVAVDLDESFDNILKYIKLLNKSKPKIMACVKCYNHQYNIMKSIELLQFLNKNNIIISLESDIIKNSDYLKYVNLRMKTYGLNDHYILNSFIKLGRVCDIDSRKIVNQKTKKIYDKELLKELLK